VVSGCPFSDWFRWGEHRHALGFAWVQLVLPQLACDRKPSHGSSSIRDPINAPHIQQKTDYRFIALINKKRMLFALSTVTPLSCRSAPPPRCLSLSLCRWVCFLVLLHLGGNMGHFEYTNSSSYSLFFPLDTTSSLASLLCLMDIRLHVHHSFVQTGSSRLRPLFIYVYIYPPRSWGLDGHAHSPHLPFLIHSLPSHSVCVCTSKYLVILL